MSVDDGLEDIMLLNALVGDGLPAVAFVLHLNERNMYTCLASFSMEGTWVTMRTYEASPLSRPFAAWIVDDDGQMDSCRLRAGCCEESWARPAGPPGKFALSLPAVA